MVRDAEIQLSAWRLTFGAWFRTVAGRGREDGPSAEHQHREIIKIRAIQRDNILGEWIKNTCVVRLSSFCLSVCRHVESEQCEMTRTVSKGVSRSHEPYMAKEPNSWCVDQPKDSN